MNLEKVFRTILKPALGCTEPVAVALSVSAAAAASGGWVPRSAVPAPVAAEEITDILVRVNKSIFKNAFSIYIPNAEGHKGILMSAALGVFCCPTQGLEIFKDLTGKQVEAAETLIQQGKVRVEVVEVSDTDLYIEAEVTLARAGAGRRGTALIRDEHSRIALLTRDGEEIFRRQGGHSSASAPDQDLEELKSLSLAEVVALVEDLPPAVEELIQATIAMNTRACEAGLDQPMGLGAGYFGASSEGEDPGDILRRLGSIAAAGSDARMSGFPLPVMSSAGSGNQGIIATVPVVAFARERRLPEETLVKAVALSHLMNMYISLYVGFLSALCGVAIKAGVGAACGITYAMGGGAREVGLAVKVMAASLAGMICDGAKPGCALKVSSAADMATRAATLAMEGVDVSDENGIVALTAEDTIRNMGILSRSMDAVDRKILEIMNDKLRPKS